VWEGDWEVLQGISTPQDKVVDETKFLKSWCCVSGSVIGLLVCGWANRQD
jgi:hypothetical protein